MSLAITMNKRVTLQQHAVGDDASGEPNPGWTNVIVSDDGKVWASVTDVTGKEFMAAGGTQNAVQTTICIRFREEIVSAMRVLHGADVYNIEAVLGTDRRTLLLMCSRGVNDG